MSTTGRDEEEVHIEASRAPLLDHLIELRQRLMETAITLKALPVEVVREEAPTPDPGPA